MRQYLLFLMLVMGTVAIAQNEKILSKKLSPRLAAFISSARLPDSIDVSLSVKKSRFPEAFSRVLAKPFPGFFILRLPATEVLKLAALDEVIFISQIYGPTEELTTGAADPTLNLIPFAQHRFPQIRGQGVATSVKERLFDTTDIDFKGRIFRTGLENPSGTAHASLMATIMAGAGNSSPWALGAAPGALLSSSSFTNLFPDPDAVFRRHSITLQNHSYGTVVETFYGNEAAAYDQAVVNQPNLLHVFSAGNAGTTTTTSGVYAGVAEMANLTGNFKQAKNLMTVSGIDSMGGFLPLSSKGPAHDGRVKPELVAYGEDGSSGAAALVSGAAVLVQDAFQQSKGSAAPAALVKAVLLNSANDVGEKQVDYLSGFGSLNAFRAVQAVSGNYYYLDSVGQGQSKMFSITIPPGAAGLKLTLVWTDLPALPNASKALVNDLDLTLRSPSGTTWLPWVLNPLPDRASLLQPAERKRDTLNNTEQITVDLPAAGEYTIAVSGARVLARQVFAVVYQVDTLNSFYWTWPTAADPLLAGNRHTLRWQSDLSGAGRIEYATAGENWRPVGTVDSLGKKYLKWEVPDSNTVARLRMIAGTAVFVSDTFAISRQLSLQTGFNCADSFLLFWQSLPAGRYQLYQLGNRYLQPFTGTADTSLVLAKQQHPSLHYAVAPLIGGKEGFRSYTVNYTAQAVGCYLRSFYLQSQGASGAFFVAEIGTVFNVAAVGLEVLNAAAFVPLQTIAAPATTTFNFSNVPLRQGENRFRFFIRLANGTVLYSAVETVYTVNDGVPVFVYPNPVAQNGELRLLTQEAGRYTLLFFDAAGRQVYRQALNNSVTLLPANRFPKGLYFIRVLDQYGSPKTLKQIIQ